MTPKATKTPERNARLLRASRLASRKLPSVDVREADSGIYARVSAPRLTRYRD